jgi:hypothetical protein
LEFTNEYPWLWSPSHVDEWSLWLVSEQHLAPSTIRAYQGVMRLFSEFLIDGRYFKAPPAAGAATSRTNSFNPSADSESPRHVATMAA